MAGHPVGSEPRRRRGAARLTGQVEHARASIANFEVPRSIEFREILPTSPQGKVLKTQLRADEWGVGEGVR